jgi:hypothetical protein
LFSTKYLYFFSCIDCTKVGGEGGMKIYFKILPPLLACPQTTSPWAHITAVGVFLT